ncbi:hypothetical protein EHQ58_05315 [Leptospira ognonensis]|uniref:Kelch-like protein n=1 Tax=Leptospira ognonensis TaxID=2484945 RepID=A0A4R9K6I1_9LEPT|nr:kelch-like protein [Leptospira ognonensis]TGL61201.1 hypothetical protein EHQ58_05315 [Leptospira ognonensis]
MKRNKIFILFVFILMYHCKINPSVSPNDMEANNVSLMTQLLLNPRNLNCKFSPENGAIVQTVSSIVIECQTILQPINTDSHAELEKNFSLIRKDNFKLELLPLETVTEGKIQINFDFLLDTNGRTLSEPNYEITVDKTNPTVKTEFGTSLVGLSDFDKGFIELEYSEPMKNHLAVGNYSFGGIGGGDLIISEIAKLDGNKIRIFILGNVNRNGGEVTLTLRNITDMSGNTLSDSLVKINMIGARIVANLSQGRRNHASVYFNGKIYVFGGRVTNSATTALNTLEIFNPETLQIENLISWSAGIAPALSLHRAVLLSNQKILIVGGVNASSVNVATSFLFDPISETFSSGPNLTAQRRDFLTHTIGSIHYIIGGTGTGSNSIEKYSESSNAFSASFNMQKSRTAKASICSSNDSTFSVFGGATGTDAIETFNVSSGIATVSSSVDAIGNVVCKIGSEDFRFAGQSDSAQKWNLALNTKTSEFVMEQAGRSGFSNLEYGETQDIIIGGLIGANVTDSIELIDWEKNKSRQIGKLNYPKSSGTLTKIPNENRAYYIGGQYSNASYNIIEEIRW